MKVAFDAFCQSIADQCVSQYGGGKVQHYGPFPVPGFDGDPTLAEARIENLILERIPNVVPSVSIDARNQLTIRVSQG